MSETQPTQLPTEEFLRMHKEAMLKGYITSFRATAKSLGENPHRKDVFEYGKKVALLIAASTPETREDAFETALSTQTALLRLQDESVTVSVSDITHNAQEFFPHDPHVAVFGLVHDLSQYTHAFTPEAQNLYRARYIRTHLSLLGKNDPEISGLVSQVHARANELFSTVPQSLA